MPMGTKVVITESLSSMARQGVDGVIQRDGRPSVKEKPGVHWMALVSTTIGRKAVRREETKPLRLRAMAASRAEKRGAVAVIVSEKVGGFLFVFVGYMLGCQGLL